ncbi:hypothetical protein V1520DRAFT_325864 [Lipomyces starkeyi]|uniref:BZIP domain-containing protein n=1 Tax=Lipomyces starkeyi NRRL Y-11557 TaxID=675824 RepID=A0A1E3PZT2_LIPST|nr:hypothetical protein LIPSTDRAFT_65382 [Lipomyces starkeyi NRRL Y-11557]
MPLFSPVYTQTPAPSRHAHCVNAPACFPQLASDNSYPSGTFSSFEHPPLPNYEPLPSDPFFDSNALSSTVDTDAFAIPGAQSFLCHPIDGSQHVSPTALLPPSSDILTSSHLEPEFADPLSFVIATSNGSANLDFVAESEPAFDSSTGSTQALPAHSASAPAIDLVVADSEIHFVANADKMTARRIRNTVTAQRHRQNNVRRIRELEKLLDECEASKERWKKRALRLGWNESAHE